MPTYKLLLLPGDGIGPEVMGEVEKVAAALARTGLAQFEFERGLVGGCAYDAHGRAMSDSGDTSSWGSLAWRSRRRARAFSR